MKLRRCTSLVMLLVLLAGLLLVRPVPVRGTGFAVQVDFDDSEAHDDNLGDCVCADTYGFCTLRAAIEEANNCPGVDVITFDTAMNIYVDTSVGSLPSLNETVTIDASSVWNNVDDTPGVMINGGSGSFAGLLVSADSCQIYGLYITAFNGTGVYVTSGSNWIGGTGAGQRNVISGNDTGLTLSGGSALSNVVRNNYFGLTPAGNTKNPNATGMLITGGASDNIIGGNEAGHTNYFSGNTTNGVLIEISGSDSNWLGYNVIGLSVDLTVELGNGGYGIRINNGPDNTVIGGTSSSGNFIAANGSSGIYIGNTGSGTQISHNIIGSNTLDGISIYDTAGVVMSNNIIGSNALSGVRVSGASAAGNLIWPNSIYANGNEGISVQDGGNMNIAAPVIGNASRSGASGTTCGGCRVAVYSDLGSQGQVYHSIEWADGAGNWSYTGTLSGPNVTATAIDGTGNTSEFSAPYALPPLQKTFLPMINRNK